MDGRNLTDKQAAVLLVLAERTGLLTTNELGAMLNAVDADDERPEIRYLGNEQLVAVGRQLTKKGLAEESGVPFGPKRWRATDAGRERADSIRGLI